MLISFAGTMVDASELQKFINGLIQQRDRAVSEKRKDMFRDMIDGCLLTLDTLKIQYNTELDETYDYAKIELI